MPALEYFVVAESSAVDRETNRVSLFNVVEVISTVQFPLLIPNLVAVTAWNAAGGQEDEEFQANLLITGPIPANLPPINTNFVMETPRHRTFQRLQGLPVEAAGQLRFEIQLNGVHMAFHTIDVQLVGAN